MSSVISPIPSKQIDHVLLVKTNLILKIVEIAIEKYDASVFGDLLFYWFIPNLKRESNVFLAKTSEDLSLFWQHHTITTSLCFETFLDCKGLLEYLENESFISVSDIETDDSSLSFKVTDNFLNTNAYITCVVVEKDRVHVFDIDYLRFNVSDGFHVRSSNPTKNAFEKSRCTAKLIDRVSSKTCSIVDGKCSNVEDITYAISKNWNVDNLQKLKLDTEKKDPCYLCCKRRKEQVFICCYKTASMCVKCALTYFKDKSKCPTCTRPVSFKVMNDEDEVNEVEEVNDEDEVNDDEVEEVNEVEEQDD